MTRRPRRGGPRPLGRARCAGGAPLSVGYRARGSSGSLGTSYAGVHHVIADGNFVFTLSEGSRDGAAYGFYDLFRVEGGDIVEHWDSRRVVPSSTMSGLEIF